MKYKLTNNRRDTNSARARVERGTVWTKWPCMPLACIHIRCGRDARDWSPECARPYLSLVHTSIITSFLVPTCTWCGLQPIIRAAWAMPILIYHILSPSLFLSSFSYLPLPSGVRGYTGCLPTLMGGYGRLPGH